MTRPLNNHEYFAFLDDVHVFVPYETGDPRAYDPPPWGGIVEWEGMFVLVYPLPNGEVALTDITDGIPMGDRIIRVQDYLATVPTRETPGARIYGLAEGFMEGLRNVAQLPQLALDWGPLVVAIGVAIAAAVWLPQLFPRESAA
jgi:hypothetical protein